MSKYLYRGQALENLTKKELIEAVIDLGTMLQQESKERIRQLTFLKDLASKS